MDTVPGSAQGLSVDSGSLARGSQMPLLFCGDALLGQAAGRVHLRGVERLHPHPFPSRSLSSGRQKARDVATSIQSKQTQQNQTQKDDDR